MKKTYLILSLIAVLTLSGVWAFEIEGKNEIASYNDISKIDYPQNEPSSRNALIKTQFKNNDSLNIYFLENNILNKLNVNTNSIEKVQTKADFELKNHKGRQPYYYLNDEYYSTVVPHYYTENKNEIPIELSGNSVSQILSYKNDDIIVTKESRVGGYSIKLYVSKSNSIKEIFTFDSDMTDSEWPLPSDIFNLKLLTFLNSNQVLIEVATNSGANEHGGLYIFNIDDSKIELLYDGNEMLSFPVIIENKIYFSGIDAIKKEPVHSNSKALYSLDINTGLLQKLYSSKNQMIFIGQIEKPKLLSLGFSISKSNLNLKLPWETGLQRCTTRDGQDPPSPPIGSNITCSNLGNHDYPNAYDFDTSNISDEFVLASSAGVVTLITETSDGYGKHIRITHPNNEVTLYAHLEEFFVSEGDIVSQGCLIGFEGNTGGSDGDHIHFEYEAPGSTHNLEPTFIECDCTPHAGYQYISNNFEQNCDGECNTDFEPNNTISSATPQHLIGDCFSWQEDINTSLDLSASDVDVYEIFPQYSGDLEINLNRNDLGFELVDGNGQSVSNSQSSGSSGQVINWQGGFPFGGCLPPIYIRVSPISSSTSCVDYELSLDWQSQSQCQTQDTGSGFTGNQNGLEISGNTSLCQGQSSVLSVTGGSGQYSWILDEELYDTGNSIIIENLNADSYVLVVVDTETECLSASVDIDVSNSLTANAGQDETITSGGNVQLQGTGGSSYSWTPTSSLSNPNVFNPIATPSQTTTYTLTVAQNGCTDTDQVTVIVDDGGGGDVPPNDNCNDAITLQSNTSCNSTFGTVDFATMDGFPNDPSCDFHNNPNAFGVFYSFIAQDDTHTITVNPTGTLDAVVTVYEGSECNALEEFDCEDTPGGNGGTTTLTNANFDAGEQYWVRVYDYGSVEPSIGDGGFNICITHQEDSEPSDCEDLIVEILDVGDINPDAGDTVSITYRVTNIGDETNEFAFVSSIYISQDQDIEIFDDQLEGSITSTQPLSPGESETYTVNAEIPNDINDGQYYLIAVTDAVDVNDEVSETNNFDVQSIQVGDVEETGPNFDIDGLTAIPNSNLAPSQEIRMEFEIENEGNRDANDFVIGFYFDLNDNGDYDPGQDPLMRTKNINDLDAGEEFDTGRDMFLPSNIPSTGNYRIFVVVDIENDVNETDETDNIFIETVNIGTTNPAGPDLIANYISVEIDSSDEIVDENDLCMTIDYRFRINTENIGSLQASGNGTTIRSAIYISRDQIVDGSDIRLGTQNSGVTIDVGEIDESSEDYDLFGFSEDNYFLIIVADVNNIIDEIDESNNITILPITISNCNNDLLPDLSIAINSVTPFSSNLGDFLTTEMTVTNNGDALVENFRIGVYASEDNSFDGDGAGIVDNRLQDDGSENFQISLEPGESIQVSMTGYTNMLDVEFTETGLMYLFAVVDEFNDYNEISKENNIASVPIEINSFDCYYNLPDQGMTIAYDTNSFFFGVDTENDCTYISNGVEDWIGSPNNASETGFGSVFTTVDDNPFPFSRTGTITVGHEIFEFIQEARPCEELEDDIRMLIQEEEVTDISCNESGRIDISITQGFPPYSYQWSNGAVSQDLEFIGEAGTYTVIISDASGCNIEQSFTINGESTLDNSVTQDNALLTAQATGVSYQWIDCDNDFQPIPEETNQSFEAPQNGRYAVEITDGSCTATSECIEINFLGVNEFELSDISIYPNPFESTITVEIGNIQEAEYAIYSITGQKLKNGSIQNNRNSIDLSILASGIYFIDVLSNSKSVTKKIIKE